MNPELMTKLNIAVERLIWKKMELLKEHPEIKLGTTGSPVPFSSRKGGAGSRAGQPVFFRVCPLGFTPMPWTKTAGGIAGSVWITGS